MTGKVQNRIRDERSHRLHSIGSELKQEFCMSQLGQTRTVIFEQKKQDGTMSGFTDNYVEVHCDFHPEFLHLPGIVDLIGPEKNGIVTAKLISMKPLP
jgi:tRNA A37 methylthiotransferase MiaB